MACGARWGLKAVDLAGGVGAFGGLNGLWCPLGFESRSKRWHHRGRAEAKWPVVPVGV